MRRVENSVLDKTDVARVVDIVELESSGIAYVLPLACGGGLGWGCLRELDGDLMRGEARHPDPLRASFARLDPAASREEGRRTALLLEIK